MEDYLEDQLNDKIEDLQNENQILREVRDDLMSENEDLRKEIQRLNNVMTID